MKFLILWYCCGVLTSHGHIFHAVEPQRFVMPSIAVFENKEPQTIIRSKAEPTSSSSIDLVPKTSSGQVSEDKVITSTSHRTCQNFTKALSVDLRLQINNLTSEKQNLQDEMDRLVAANQNMTSRTCQNTETAVEKLRKIQKQTASEHDLAVSKLAKKLDVCEKECQRHKKSLVDTKRGRSDYSMPIRNDYDSETTGASDYYGDDKDDYYDGDYYEDEVKGAPTRRITCPPSFPDQLSDVSCFRLIHRAYPFKVANRLCEDNHGRLAVLNDKEQLKIVQRVIAKSGKTRQNYLVGAYKDTPSQTLWSNRDQVDQALWAPGQPDNTRDRCVTLYRRRRFYLSDENCKIPFWSVCEVHVGKQ